MDNFFGQEQTYKNTPAELRRLKGHTKMLNCECQPGKMASNIRETVVDIGSNIIKLDYSSNGYTVEKVVTSI